MKGEVLRDRVAVVVKDGAFMLAVLEQTLDRNKRLAEKVARAADALAALTQQVEHNAQTIAQLEHRLSQQRSEDCIKSPGEKGSIQWQEVNSLLED